MERLTELSDFCRRHGLPWTDDTAERFATYLDLLLKFKDSRNLIGPFDAVGIERELFVDCAAGAVVAAPDGPIVDVGTGAGFPGIPLKILYPDCPLTLVEPREKRVTFLRIVVHKLGLEEVDIVGKRLEQVTLEPHRYATSKAFRAPAEWVEAAGTLVEPGGTITCYHSADATSELDDGAAELGLERIARASDVARDLGAPVPADRSITAFRAPEP